MNFGNLVYDRRLLFKEFEFQAYIDLLNFIFTVVPSVLETFDTPAAQNFNVHFVLCVFSVILSHAAQTISVNRSVMGKRPMSGVGKSSSIWTNPWPVFFNGFIRPEIYNGIILFI